MPLPNWHVFASRAEGKEASATRLASVLVGTAATVVVNQKPIKQ